MLRRALALAVVAGAVIVADTAATGAPRLVGSYQTLLRITAAVNITNIAPGQQAVRTWKFTPSCGAGACATTLVRPSIAAGNTSTYRYTLRPVSATRYAGSIAPTPVVCAFTSGKQVQGGYVNHQTMVLDVTRASGGKVVAYSGTVCTVNVLTAAGRAAGCPSTSNQGAVFHTTP